MPSRTLIQEELRDLPQFGPGNERAYAWAQTCACVLLNRTTGPVVRKALPDLWELAATPERMPLRDPAEVKVAIHRCGFQDVKASNLMLMSLQFSTLWPLGPDVDPRDIRPSRDFSGCGPYADDSWRIFVVGELTEHEPRDSALRLYWHRRKSELGS